MTEAPLTKVLRLAAPQEKPKSSAKKPRFGTPYRLAWGNVSVGDVLMFGNQVWKIVAPTAHPGHKMPALPAPDADSAEAGSAKLAASPAKPSSSSGKPASSGQSPAGASSLQVYTHCLQNLASPGKYEELTLPDNFVVRAVPLLP